MRRCQLKSLFAIKLLRSRGGLVLPVLLMWAFVLNLEVAGLSFYTATTARQVQSQQNHLRASYIAEAQTEKVIANIRAHFQAIGTTPTLVQLAAMEDELNLPAKYAFDDLSVAYENGGAAVFEELQSGDYSGLNGAVQTINIRATARNSTGFNSTAVTIEQEVQIQLIPIFQFGIFYDEDLEILPGPAMTFAGPVHSNTDIYLGSHASLTFNSSITANGDIFHGRKDSSDPILGDVFVKDPDGVNQNMKNSDDTWLDSSADDWLTESQTRWGGMVKSTDHNTRALKLPLPMETDARNLVIRRNAGDTPQLVAQKMDYKAHLRIVDGVVVNQAGGAVELRYCSDTAGVLQTQGTPDPADDVCTVGSIVNPISNKEFNNFREGKVIKSMDIDVAKLNGSPAFQAIAAAAVGGVIVYHSDYRSAGSLIFEDAVRLVNGAQVIAGGMTVVSENPMYVKGSFNTVSKQPTGLMSDAFNILSNNWNDTNSSKSLSYRTASNTSVNAVVMTGNTETTTGIYNGGFENIHRFLENWSGKTLTYSGSVIVLFESNFATGGWIYGGNYYTAPNRNWSYDLSLSDPSYTIPGFPSVYNITRSGWSRDPAGN